jgi:hypothetical protein
VATAVDVDVDVGVNYLDLEVLPVDEHYHQWPRLLMLMLVLITLIWRYFQWNTQPGFADLEFVDVVAPAAPPPADDAPPARLVMLDTMTPTHAKQRAMPRADAAHARMPHSRERHTAADATQPRTPHSREP